MPMSQGDQEPCPAGRDSKAGPLWASRPCLLARRVQNPGSLCAWKDWRRNEAHGGPNRWDQQVGGLLPPGLTAPHSLQWCLLLVMELKVSPQLLQPCFSLSRLVLEDPLLGSDCWRQTAAVSFPARVEWQLCGTQATHMRGKKAGRAEGNQAGATLATASRSASPPRSCPAITQSEIPRGSGALCLE